MSMQNASIYSFIMALDVVNEQKASINSSITTLDVKSCRKVQSIWNGCLSVGAIYLIQSQQGPRFSFPIALLPNSMCVVELLEV